MKKSFLLALVSLLLAFTACAQTSLDDANFNEKYQDQSTVYQKVIPPAGIVYAQGTQFMLDNKPYYFAGCNAYSIFTSGQNWMTNSLSEIENYMIGKDKIDTFMSNMAFVGVKVLRTWGFSHEAWMGFEPTKGNFVEPAFMKFDYILESAKRHGIKVIIVLENYWEAYGGIDARLKWEGLPSGTSAARVAFFTNEACKTQYRNYIKYFVGRTNHYTLQPYKTEPGIFSWELMNEPRCQDGDTTGSILRPWVDEMASLIKSIDPNHMVSTGMEGQETRYGYGGNSGNPFVYIHQSPYIDFCTAHPYPDEGWAGLSPAQAATLVDKWVSDAHNVVGKPFVLEEFNTHNNKEAYWNAMYSVIESKNAGGDCFWNFNLQNTSDFDMLPGNTILNTLFKAHADKMAAKSGPVSSASTSSVIISSLSSMQQSSAASSVSSRNDNPGTLKIQTFQSGTVLQNQISQKIRLVNSGTSPIVLSTVKIRYYITYQGSQSYNFHCDYSPIGSANVIGAFAALNPAQAGADAYNEISFTTAAGSIAPGASIELQCRTWKSDWSNIDNSLNYSYNPATAYVDWNKVTAYQNGTLSFGIVPGGVVSSTSSIISSSRSSAPVSSISSAISSSSLKSISSVSSVLSSSSKSSVSSTPVSSSVTVSSKSSLSASSSSVTNGALKVKFYNGGTALSVNQINARFQIVNTGNSAIALSTVKLRYYYTKDGTQNQQFWCDYSTAGTGNVTGLFTAVNPAQPTADTYVELNFASAAGSVAPGASVDVQTRLAQANWTSYNQGNDYSFNPTATAFVDWNKVTAYQNGALVWGAEPGGSTSSATSTVSSAVSSSITASSSSQSSAQAVTLRALANQKGLIFGGAITVGLLNDTAYRSTLSNEFNCIVAGNEMKVSYLEPTQNTFTYGTADTMVNFAVANGMKIRGHTLLWHADYQVPQWIKNLDYSLLAAAERNHVSNVISHFGNKIYCWDVANEIVQDNGSGLRNRTAGGGDYSVWASSLTDDSVIRAAFIQARQTATAMGINMKLFLNDYSIEEKGSAKTEKFYQIVSNWVASGVPIDGVGFQCHFMEKYTPNYNAIRQNIDRFQALGLEVEFTEIDVRIELPTNQTKLNNQASIYGNMMQIALEKNVKAFVIWGIADKDSWVMSTFPGYGAPLIFDDNFNKKPAYFALQQKLAQ